MGTATAMSNLHDTFFRSRRACLGILAAAGLAGCRGMQPLSPAETVMSATCLMASEKAVGTGFLMAIRDRETPGGFRPVVVTSAHLLKSGRRRGVAIPLRVVDADGHLLVIVVSTGRPPENTPWYAVHPKLDVAVFALPLSESLPTPCYLPFLEERNLETIRPRAGENVFFSGYPEGLTTSEALYPVLRPGTVASLDQNVFDLPYFLISGDVHPGDSGAPVFRNTRSGTPRLIGMVIQRLGPSDQRLPLAQAIDSGGIRETLELFARQHRSQAGQTRGQDGQ